MSKTGLICGLVNAGLCAFDVAMWAKTGSTFSLGAAVFCGLCSLACFGLGIYGARYNL